jgi:hypothetical protein
MTAVTSLAMTPAMKPIRMVQIIVMSTDSGSMESRNNALRPSTVASDPAFAAEQAMLPHCRLEHLTMSRGKLQKGGA